MDIQRINFEPDSARRAAPIWPIAAIFLPPTLTSNANR
jgi:hypothetical protein